MEVLINIVLNLVTRVSSFPSIHCRRGIKNGRRRFLLHFFDAINALVGIFFTIDVTY